MMSTSLKKTTGRLRFQTHHWYITYIAT